MVGQAVGLCYRKETLHFSRLNIEKIIPFCHNLIVCLENFVLFVLTLDLTETVLFLLLCMAMESWTLRFCQNRITEYLYLREWKAPRLTETCTHQRPKIPKKIVKPQVLEERILFSWDNIYFSKSKCGCK